jgi:hypothetical protein
VGDKRDPLRDFSGGLYAILEIVLQGQMVKAVVPPNDSVGEDVADGLQEFQDQNSQKAKMFMAFRGLARGGCGILVVERHYEVFSFGS